MIREERLLKVLRAPRFLKKRLLRWKNPTPSYSKLLKTRPKQKSKLLCRNCLKSKSKSLTPRVVKGKVKRHGQRIGRRSDWKKAYVTLKEGQNLDFVGGAE